MAAIVAWLRSGRPMRRIMGSAGVEVRPYTDEEVADAIERGDWKRGGRG